MSFVHVRRYVAAIMFLLCAGLLWAKPVPELKLRDIDGAQHKLSSFRGQIVVLNFWATWCGPCKEEMPRLDALARKYAGKNVAFIAVSLDDGHTRNAIAPFLQRQSISLPVWVGADTGTLDRFHMGGIVPATLILDEQGEAVTRISGEARDADITDALNWLLNGRTGPAPAEKVKRY